MFTINLHGKESIYEQIRSQIIRFIKIGILRPDDKLPSVRELSMELGINPNTVQRAYSQLESDGYLYILSKKGAFIADRHVDKDEMIISFKKEVIHYRDEGLTHEDVLKTIEEVYGGKQ